MMSNDIYNDTDNNENNDKDSRMIVLQIKRKKKTLRQLTSQENM